MITCNVLHSPFWKKWSTSITKTLLAFPSLGDFLKKGRTFYTNDATLYYFIYYVKWNFCFPPPWDWRPCSFARCFFRNVSGSSGTAKYGPPRTHHCGGAIWSRRICVFNLQSAQAKEETAFYDFGYWFRKVFFFSAIPDCHPVASQTTFDTRFGQR